MRSAIALPGLLGLARRALGTAPRPRARAPSAASAARAARSASADAVGRFAERRPRARCAASAASSASSASARRAAICAGAACRAACSACGCVPPCRQVADPAAGIGRALRPVGALRRDAPRRAVRAACSAPASRVRRVPRRPPTAGAASAARAASTAPRSAGQVGQRALRLARLREAAAGLLALGGQALDLVVDRRQPGGDRRRPGRAAAACAARARSSRCSASARAARACCSAAVAARSAVAGRVACRSRSSPRASLGRCEVALQHRQPVALLQPDRRGGRRAGADRVAVPAPDRALAGDQHLAGRQLRLASRRRLPRRRPGRSATARAPAPAAPAPARQAASTPTGRPGIGSNGGSSRQCRAASRSAAEVSSSPSAAPSAASRPAGTVSASTIGGQRSPSFTASTSARALRLGGQLGARRVGGGLPLARGGQRRHGRPRGPARRHPAPSAPPPARPRPRPARHRPPRAPPDRPPGRRCGRAPRASLANCSSSAAPALLGLRRAAGATAWARAFASAAASVARLASASASAHRFGRFGDRRPRPPRRAPAWPASASASAASSAASRASAASESRLSCSACARSWPSWPSRLRRVGQRGAGALLLGGDLFLRDAMAFERGARVRLGDAQRRQRRGRLGGLRGGLGGGLGRRGHRQPRRVQRRLRLAAHRLGTGALDRQQFGLGLRGSRPRCCGSGWPAAPAASARASCASSWPRRSSARARLASAARSFSSASCRRACRPVMPAASSSTARRSSGRAVTSAPTRPWLTMPEACAPVARSANSVCTSRARTSLPLTRYSLPAPRSMRRMISSSGCSWNGGGTAPGRLVQRQRHLGEVARWPAGGAGEDHVVHLAGAQRAGALLAHRPAQRLDHVGLAAAVRADDAGQPGMDLHADRLGEALEPGDAQAAEMHGQAGSFANWRESSKTRPPTWRR